MDEWTRLLISIVGVVVPILIAMWGFWRADNKEAVQRLLDDQRRDIEIRQNKADLDEHKLFCEKQAEENKAEFRSIQEGIADVNKTLQNIASSRNS